MPTSYTNKVEDGTITSFKDFALICARAMGALILMRDDPLDAPIPDEFKPRLDYYNDCLKKSQKRLEIITKINKKELQKMINAEYKQNLKEWKETEINRESSNHRYDAMKAKVLKWVPPTEEHFAFQQFMIQQLEISKNVYQNLKPKKLDTNIWLESEIIRLKRDINYCIQRRDEEIVRTNNRNIWIKQLRDSLEDYNDD